MSGVVWVDAVLDLKSYVDEPGNRRPRKILEWFRFLLGADVFAVFCGSDTKHFLRATRFGLKLLTLPLTGLVHLVSVGHGKNGMPAESDLRARRRKLTKEPRQTPVPAGTESVSSSSRHSPGRTH